MNVRLHWNYFVSLERDFIGTLDFVELHPDNHKTFSNTYGKILFAAASEVDVVAKLLCAKLKVQGNPKNIDQYRKGIIGRIPKLHTVKIQVPRYESEWQPWRKWEEGTNPDWWRDYNKVKHQRGEFYQQANQQNALDSLCGLMVLLLYLYKLEEGEWQLSPLPGLLHYPSMPGGLRVVPTLDLPPVR